MSIVRKPVRNVSHIKTISGMVNRTAIPYMAYMRLTVLEMERARRMVEKESALERIQLLDERLTEIEREKDTLLRQLGERGESRSGGASREKEEQGETFRLKY